MFITFRRRWHCISSATCLVYLAFYFVCMFCLFNAGKDHAVLTVSIFLHFQQNEVKRVDEDEDILRYSLFFVFFFLFLVVLIHKSSNFMWVALFQLVFFFSLGKMLLYCMWKECKSTELKCNVFFFLFCLEKDVCFKDVAVCRNGKMRRK